MARFMGRLKMYEAEGIAASDIYHRMLACIQADLMRYCVRLGERALDAFEKRPSDEDTVSHVKTFLAGLRRIRQFAQVSMTMDQKRHSPRAKAAEPINDKHLATGARDHALK